MAEEIVCPVCETVNAASNETCAECGADLTSQMPAASDDPSMADTPAGDNEFVAEEGDFAEPEDYAAQDVHEDPGDVAIEGSGSEQIITEENPEDEFAEFGDEPEVDEGEFPVADDEFDEDEFGDEEDLYEEGATEQDIAPMGVAEEESEADELAQEAADEFVEDEYAEFEEEEDEYAEFEDEDDEFDEEGEQVDAELADFPEGEEESEDEFAEFEEDEDEFAEFEEDEDEFAEFEEGGEEFDEDLGELAEEASEELERDEFAEFEEEAGIEEESLEEGLAEPSEQEPPELAVILNPQREGAEDLAELPKPGPYKEPATLTLFSDRRHVGDLAVSANVLTLGLPDAFAEDVEEEPQDAPEIDESFDDPGTMELEEELIEEVEEEPLDDEDLYDEDIQLQGGGAPAEFEAEEEDEFAEFEDEASEPDEEFAEFEAEEEDEASEVSEVEESSEPVLVNLGQYADADAFADQHSYIFRQNKNYTLYVTSNAGTQLNDEILELGEHRELNDGDVIVLGGTLAMRFNMPVSA